MLNSREIVLFFAIHFKGDWSSIYNAISKKQFFNENMMREEISKVTSPYVTILDEEYPKALKTMFHPPFVIFYYGDLSLLSNVSRNIAVIGSRDNSNYGKEMTEYLVKGICARSIVVSGMAKGIDSIAHKSAIDNGGRTVAVLGNGIDYCYPANNRKLYNQIKEKHLIISEYPGTTEPTRDKFPQRNRLIAALCKAVLVTEAHKKSGTIITVDFALSSARDVMCVPYRANEDSACNKLISTGAYLVETPEDVDEIMNGGFEKK